MPLYLVRDARDCRQTFFGLLMTLNTGDHPADRGAAQSVDG
jgi:hypothetical protein